jgi:sec-independent protein translocase protein TatA
MYTVTPILAMIGPTEIIIIAIIILLLFGGRKIPELMKGLGRGMREFKDAQKNDEDTEVRRQD